MPRPKANCPACAAPVVFQCRTSMVTVCSTCKSVVARGDKKLEDHGRVADIVATDSPLALGIKGRFRSKPFLIIGRTQFQHAAGGVWDEWYCAFPNGKWGWLAEAQGQFYMTFEESFSEDALPSLDSLQGGQQLVLNDANYTIAEVGLARIGGAEGEMPVAVVPNAEHPFVDLYADNERFATLDYSTGKPQCYVGWIVTLDDLGLKDVKPDQREGKSISALKVGCPNCGGMLDLRMPDETQRVVCSFCSSMLDCNKGNLQFLSTLKPKTKPIIQLGTQGKLFGIQFTVIGFVQRSVTIGGTKYFWTEYLLYEPTTGFRWLVHSDSHWSYVEPVSPSKVKDDHSIARYDGKTFKVFQEAIARVEYVLGEFYWKVEIGESVLCRDLICPPYMLSFERTTSGARAVSKQGQKVGSITLGETSISLGTYLPHADVTAAFGVTNLPRGWIVAPNQPVPVPSEIFVKWAMFLIALVVIYGFALGCNMQPDDWLLIWAMTLVSVPPLFGAVVNASFNQRRWAESDFAP